MNGITDMRSGDRTVRSRTLCAALLLCAVLPAHADDKPFVPTMKVRTHRLSIDVQADGTTTTRHEYAYTALAEDAVASVAQDDISYHEGNGTLDDVVAYTLKADGTRIAVPETNVQVTTRNGVNGAPPAFSGLKTRRLIFPDVGVGDTAVLAYTIRDEKPTFKGYFSLLTWYSEDSYRRLPVMAVRW